MKTSVVFMLLILVSLFTGCERVCDFICDPGGGGSTPSENPDRDTLSDGLVLHQPLNGNALDASGHNLHGLVYGPVPAPDRWGNEGQAMRFDGIDDYIEVEYKRIFDFTNSFSITVWAQGRSGNPNPESITGLVGRGPAIPYGLGIDDGDRILFRAVSSGDYIEALSNDFLIDTTEWNHYAGVFEAGKAVSLYLNGTLIARRTSAVPDRVDASDLPLWIGARTHGEYPVEPWIYFFKGTMDEVRLYNRALTADEVLLLFNALE